MVILTKVKSKNGYVPYLFILVQSANGVVLHHLEVDLMPDQISDVVNSILDHSRPVVGREQYHIIENEKNSCKLTTVCNLPF